MNTATKLRPLVPKQKRITFKEKDAEKFLQRLNKDHIAVQNQKQNSVLVNKYKSMVDADIKE